MKCVFPLVTWIPRRCLHSAWACKACRVCFRPLSRAKFLGSSWSGSSSLRISPRKRRSVRRNGTERNGGRLGASHEAEGNAAAARAGARPGGEEPRAPSRPQVLCSPLLYPFRKAALPHAGRWARDDNSKSPVTLPAAHKRRVLRNDRPLTRRDPSRQARCGGLHREV